MVIKSPQLYMRAYLIYTRCIRRRYGMVKIKVPIEKKPQPTFNFKCDTDLKDAFVDTCDKLDTTASRELRAFMRKYIAKHGQDTLF